MDINKECSDALQIASEKEFISNEATYPNSPLHNTSSAPTQGEETIFLSKIKASIITVGNPSYREDKTNTSQDFIKGYGFSLNPKNVHNLAIPYHLSVFPTQLVKAPHLKSIM